METVVTSNSVVPEVQTPVPAEAYEEGQELRRTLSPGWNTVVLTVGLIISVTSFAALLFWPIDPWPFRNLHLTLVSIIGLLLYPGWSKARQRVHWLDIVLIVGSLGVGIYLFFQWEPMLTRTGVSPTTPDLVFGAIAILMVLELTRRATGWPLPTIALVALLYQWWGHLLPGVFWHRPNTLADVISFNFGTTGIYGVPLGASATFVFLFIIFGAFLEMSGTGSFILDCARALAGWARGGPAKVSIISSSFFGTMSGSAVANVMVDGWFTIPLMKSVGYTPRFAAAVEALTSSGGALVPPVMGSTAFVMAELLHIPYYQIAIAAIIPSLLYYLSLYWMIDLEALRRNLKGLPRTQLPKVRDVFRRNWYYLVPVAVLFYVLMVLRLPAVKSAGAGIIATIIVSWIGSKRIGPRQIVQGLASGPKSLVEIAAVTACAGLVIGVFSATGLGIKVGNLIAILGGESLLVALLAAAILSLLLGMAVPAVAAYVIVAGTIAPHIVSLGVDPLAAHLFVYYFAIVSAFTPPVAIAAYAAASIAKTSPFGAGLTATRLGIAAYIVPFMFVYGPALLLNGSPGEIVLAVGSASLGTYALAVAAQGWMAGPLGWPERLVSLAAAILLIKPGLGTALIGAAMLGAVFLWVKFRAFRNAAHPT